MTNGKASRRVVADRLATVSRLLEQIRGLPVGDRQAFFADGRNAPAAESCLRRSLEALLDVGRHILAKGYALGVSEHKEIAEGLRDRGVLAGADADLLRTLAGYRNRLVHYYHLVSEEELYALCAERLGDLEQIRGAFLAWVEGHPEKLDETL